MAFYPNPVNEGLDRVSSLGDGYSINIQWFQAYPDIQTNKIAYHIYFSTVKENIFTEGVKFASIDASLQANIIDLIPGQNYFFAVRPVEYDPTLYNLSFTLPIAYDNLRVYPHSLLREDISSTTLIIPLISIDGFPDAGVIKVGAELIRYSSIDIINNNLIVPAGGEGASPAHLVDQGSGSFYTASLSNIGQGIINSLILVNSNSITETWTIKCIFVQRDISNNPIAGTGKFIAIGSISGDQRNGHGDPIIWTVDNSIVSNGILSFSILETGPVFREGDSFIVKVIAAVEGADSGRGFDNSIAAMHTVSGFDGSINWDPIIPLWTDEEEQFADRIFVCQSRFEYPNYSFTIIDGYHQVIKDLLTTDYAAADAANVDFTAYDYSGYHRTDPVQLLDGTCVGSYIGGEMGCIDGYGNSQILRGLSLQDQNTQRQDVLLSVTGRPAVLLKRRWTGITSNTYLPSSEYPDDRGLDNYGGKFVFGYDQYFNPRRSDGRILVRPGPADENLKMYEGGLESEIPLDLWTLTVPTIKNRDIIILFDQDDNEEFRYEVLYVTRNNTIVGLEGGQKMRVQRIRKFDPAYQIRVFRNTADFPSTLNTTIGFVPGIPPHLHTIVRNESDPSNWSQTTSISQGHNHPVLISSGLPVVMEALGHDHKIII